jgi:hypothetical protein
MNFAWSYFWPMMVVGMAIGLAAGLIASRRRAQIVPLALGAVVALAAAALLHGPLGAAERFRVQVDRTAKLTLDAYEMTGIDARLQQGPATRTLRLTGPADDFQRQELVRLLGTISGVKGATWSFRRGWPLLVEAMLVGLGGYLLGLLLAHLVELHRRNNAQYQW